MKKLPDYPDDKKLSGTDAGAVLWAAAERVDDEEELEGLSFPGVPDWAGLYGDTTEWDGWSAGLVRKCLALIASASGEDRTHDCAKRCATALPCFTR